MITNKTKGITIIFGNNFTNRKLATLKLHQLFPDAIILHDDDFDLKNTLNTLKQIIEANKDKHNHYILPTNNLLTLRSIECYCDYYDCMSDLDVFDIEDETNIIKASNVMYSNFGISEIYGRYNDIYENLNQLICNKRD